MGSRMELSELFRNILRSDNVYFQPPESVKMKYPAITYSKSDIRNVHANNNVYKQNYFYTVIVIDRDPESEIVTQISQLPRCRWVRGYTADNLYHDVFELFL